jgi:integrase/recombinase XerD
MRRPAVFPCHACSRSRVRQDFLAVRRELVRGPDSGALLINPYGKRVRTADFQRLLKKLSKRLGFIVHPHLLRHSIAVHLLRRGADIRIIQQFLGHADLDTTRIYLRMVPGHLREAYDRSMIVIDVFGGLSPARQL